MQSCSKRTNIIRRKFSRVERLTTILRLKFLALKGQFRDNVHFIDVIPERLDLTTRLWEFVGKGLSYIPSGIGLSDRELSIAIRDFGNRIFWKFYWAFHPPPVATLTSSQLLMKDFCESHRPKGTLVKEFPLSLRQKYSRIQSFVDDVDRNLKGALVILRQQPPLRHLNCSRLDISQLKRLRDCPEFIIRQADKNLGTVFISRDKYNEMCLQELGHMKLESLSRAEVEESILKCQDELKFSILPRLYSDFQARLERVPEMPMHDFLKCLPRMHCLPKIHKPTLRGRPIVAAYALPFHLLSQFLGWRINTLMMQDEWLKEHLVVDSRSVVRRLEGKQLDTPKHDLFAIAFDVVELYPSLPTNDFVRLVVKQFLQRMGAVDTQLLLALLNFLLEYNWFRYRDQFFIQKMGLAMGHAHSPPVANLLFFLLFERAFLLKHDRWEEFGIVIYQRYLDDGFMIVDSTVANIERMKYQWGCKIPGISFTWEVKLLTPSSTSVSFLDLRVGLDQRSCLFFQTFEKILNKYLYIAADSDHPSSVKRSLVTTELIRHARNCTFQCDFDRFKNSFWYRLRARGYSRIWLRRAFSSVQFANRQRYLAPSSRDPHDIIIFRIRFCFSSRSLKLSQRINGLLDENIRALLGLSVSDRIITCFTRSSNLREMLLRTGDDRTALELRQYQVMQRPIRPFSFRPLPLSFGKGPKP